MKHYQKMPSSNFNNTYKNVTVAPLQLPSTRTSNQNSPRSSSKTKIKLVSSLNRLSSTAFAPKNNVSLLPTANQTICSPRRSVHIELGGRSESKNKENSGLSSEALLKVKSGAVPTNIERPMVRENIVVLGQPICVSKLL
jgi:hypothetical protein